MLSKKRFGAAGGLAFAAAVLFGQTALADTEVGQTGNYLFTDDMNHPGATCKYKQDANDPFKYWIKSITAVAPQVWWPNTDSSNTSEHGPVAWRFAVQVSHTMGSTWSTVAHSSFQRKTAYEDRNNTYDPGTKAPFTNMTVSFNGKSYGGDDVWRIVTRPIWYNPNGSVRGYVKHTVLWYNRYWAGSATISANPFCSGLIQLL